MALQCGPCADMTLEKLLLPYEEKEDNEPHYFCPTKAYKHHPSFDHLEQAADDGCGFCQFLLDCFKGAPRRDYYPGPSEWESGLVEPFMYHAVKGLDVSDVKMFLISSNGSGVVFDEMVVHVGDRSSSRAPRLRLRLSTPRDSPTKFNGLKIGSNQLDPNLGSDVNHGIARGWLEECRSSHPGCIPSSEPPQLPTRVVDVGTSNLDAARIIHSNGLAAEYVALSHCWGGDIATTLTSKTASQFQQALPQAQLPANFRDSIIIVRQLGIRYLWIDSLCILQDSTQDWERESQRMTSVYGNATLTLSASAASGSSVGLLMNYPITPHYPIASPGSPPRTIRIHSSSDDHPYYFFAHPRDHTEESLSRLNLVAPLALRGWALQEYVLSRRILFYGARQIYWSCRQANEGADGLCQLYEDFKRHYPHICNLLHSSTPRTLEQIGILLKEYYKLISQYSVRILTYPRDKLPAIAGLTRSLQPILKTEYLAGLWLSDIHRGLLWSQHWRRAEDFVPPRAPSWSWAARDGFVKFPYGQTSHWGREGMDGELMMEVTGCEVVLSEAGNGFGQVVAGRLVVKTRLMELVRSEQRVHWSLTMGLGRISYDWVTSYGKKWWSGHPVVMEGFVLSVEADHDLGYDTVSGEKVFEMDREAEMERGYFLMLVHADEEGVEVESRDGPASTKCLVVRRVEGGKDTEFERVGMATVHNTKTAWLDTWEKRVLTLV